MTDPRRGTIRAVCVLAVLTVIDALTSLNIYGMLAGAAYVELCVIADRRPHA